MKNIFFILLYFLAACGQNGEIQQPVAIPPTIGTPRTIEYKPLIGKTRYCSAYLSINGTRIQSGYSIACNYDKNGYVDKFLITYYFSLPALATLNYYLY